MLNLKVSFSRPCIFNIHILIQSYPCLTHAVVSLDNSEYFMTSNFQNREFLQRAQMCYGKNIQFCQQIYAHEVYLVLKDTVKPRRFLRLVHVFKLLFLILFRVCIISPGLRKSLMTPSVDATSCTFSTATPPPCDGNAPLPLWKRQE